MRAINYSNKINLGNGVKCPICGAIVDRNEFNYCTDRCDDCEDKLMKKAETIKEIDRLCDSNHVQMKMEDLLI